jgi:ribose transport system substrate-binding protein
MIKRIMSGKWILILLFMLVLQAVVYGLGNSEKPGTLFGASYMTMNNPFFVALNDGIKDIVEARGDRVIVLDPALDQEKQITQINYLIEKGVDLIFLNPVDWKGVRPALEAAEEASIPVINVDSPVFDRDMVASIVTSDNYNAGVLVALDVYVRTGGTADVVLLEHPETKSGIDRTQSFVDTVKDMSGIHIIARENSLGQLEYAMPVMEKIIRENESIDVVMCTNDPQAMGALAALEAAGRAEGVYIYGIDGAPSSKKKVKEGKITATVAQSPMGIGRRAAEMAYTLLEHGEVEKEILVPVELIDSSNVDNYGLDGWQ